MRNVTLQPRYGPLRKANFLASVENVAAAFMASAMATTFREGTMPVIRLDFAALSANVFPREQIEHLHGKSRMPAFRFMTLLASWTFLD